MIKTYAKKKFGQNFLNDKNILKRISSVIDIENRNIIEIGPGKGALTKYLIEKANKVVAFEIDYNLFDFLKNEFKESNLEIINQDFLKSDLSQYKGFDIVANIPYNISTDIIFKLFENNHNFENVVLLVQKEFAQRLVAKPNTKEYSKLAPTTKLFYEATYCFDVPPEAFWPKPKVTSAVVHLRKSKVKYDIDYKEFMAFIKQCFSMRRKTLWNNIKSLGFELNHFKLLCDKLELNINVRPENLTLENLLFLFKNTNIKKN